MTIKKITSKIISAVTEEAAARNICLEIVEREILKVNKKWKALEISKKDTSIKALIYPEDYIDCVKNEGENNFIQLAKYVLDKVEQSNSLADPSIYSLEYIKNNVITQVINAKKNEELLTMVPYKAFLDLAFIFRVTISEDLGYVVNLSHMKSLNITVEELAAWAFANDSKIGYTTELLNKMLGINSPDPQLWCVSRKDMIFGASVIAHTDIFTSLSETLDSDLIILPSSNNELLVFKSEKDLDDFDAFRDMVQQVNATLVPEQFISDNVYIYRRSTKKVEIAA